MLHIMCLVLMQTIDLNAAIKGLSSSAVFGLHSENKSSLVTFWPLLFSNQILWISFLGMYVNVDNTFKKAHRSSYSDTASYHCSHYSGIFQVTHYDATTIDLCAYSAGHCIIGLRVTAALLMSVC
jgi:hypothetical protein